MADPKSAFGAQLQLGDGASPENFTTIAALRSINGLNLGNDVEETTTHDSADRARTYVTTLRKSSTISLGVLLDSADPTHDPTTGLIAKAKATGANNYKMILTDTGALVADFAGIVENFEVGNEVDGLVEADMSIQITGAIALS